jgi:hypothetical protein
MVCSHSILWTILNHSGCRCGLVSDALSRVTAKRVAESDSLSGNSEEGLAVWRQVSSVLTHPRCINCHTATGILNRAMIRTAICSMLSAALETKRVPGLNCAVSLD